MKEPWFSIHEFLTSTAAYAGAILATLGLVVAVDFVIQLFQ